MQKSRLVRSHLKLGFKTEQPFVDVEGLRARVEKNLVKKHLFGLKKESNTILNANRNELSILCRGGPPGARAFLLLTLNLRLVCIFISSRFQVGIESMHA